MYTRSPPRLDLAEEHLDEAAFLFDRWRDALVSATYTLDEVADGPEDRLAAHLDGLVVVGRPMAEQVLLPALEEEDASRAGAAAWALLAAEDADHFDAVLGAFAAADGEKAATLTRSFALSPHPATVTRLLALWKHAEPALRVRLLSVLSALDLNRTHALVDEAVLAGDPALLSAALRVLRRLPAAAAPPWLKLERAWLSNNVELRDEALATGLARGHAGVWDAAAAFLSGDTWWPFAVVALSPSTSARARLLTGLSARKTAAPTLWSLGFAGDAEAGDILAAHLGDKRLGPIAGEALATITGITVEGPYCLDASERETDESDDDEVKDDDPPPRVTPESALLAPDPDALADHWTDRRRGLREGDRLLGGAGFSSASLGAALRSLTMWRRPAVAVELARLLRAPVSVDLSAWARIQRQMLAPPTALPTASQRR